MKKYLLALLLSLFSLSTAEAANRFAVCTVTCTWDASSTAMWSTTTGGVVGASVPGSGDAAVFDGATCVGGVTCTITVSTSPTIQTLTMGACTAATTGCILDFSSGTNNITMSVALNVTGTGTRTLKMGSGTFTVSSTSNPVDFSTVTNLTLDAGTSNLTLSGNISSVTNLILGAGTTFATVTLGAASNKGGWNFTSANTITSLVVNAPNALQFPAGASVTVNGMNTSGGSLSNPVYIGSGNTSTQATMNRVAGTTTLDYVFMRNIIASGGATFNATNSVDLGRNTGFVFTAPTSGASRCIGC